MTTKTAAALAISLLFTADAWAQTEAFNARARRWRGGIDGDFGSDSGAVSGPDFDLHATAGMNEDADLDDFGVIFNFPGLGRLNLQYWQGSYAGDDTTLTQDLAFNGTTFTAGTPINAELDWRIGSLLIEYNPQGTTILGAGSIYTLQAGFKYLDIRGNVQSATTSLESTVKGYLPAVGLHARTPFGQSFAIDFEVNAALVDTVKLQGVSGVYYDVAVSGQVAIRSFYAGAGYRWFHLDARDDSGGGETRVDTMIEGFFAEIGYKM